MTKRLDKCVKRLNNNVWQAMIKWAFLDTINDRSKKEIRNLKSTKIYKASKEYHTSRRQRGTEIAFQAHSWHFVESNEFISEKRYQISEKLSIHSKWFHILSSNTTKFLGRWNFHGTLYPAESQIASCSNDHDHSK